MIKLQIHFKYSGLFVPRVGEMYSCSMQILNLVALYTTSNGSLTKSTVVEELCSAEMSNIPARSATEILAVPWGAEVVLRSAKHMLLLFVHLE